jgi:hypothetical protein
MTSTQSRYESLAAPSRLDAVLLVIAVSGVSFSGPLMAATVAPALAIALWRNVFGALATLPVALVRHGSELRALTRRAVLIAAAAGVALAAHFATWVPSVTPGVDRNRGRHRGRIADHRSRPRIVRSRAGR